MQVYLVRRVEDHGILGIFWGSKADVWDCVDEIADPADFEYAALKSGGIYHGGETEPKAIQYGDETEENAEEFMFAGYGPSEIFGDAVYDQKRLRWHSFDCADEGVGIIARAVAVVEREQQS